MKKIFISAPYSHDDATIKQKRVDYIHKYCLQLFNEGHAAISPIVMGLSIAKYGNLPDDNQTWKKYSETLLKGCDEVHVLTLSGWDISVGVKYELEEAARLNIKVRYI